MLSLDDADELLTGTAIRTPAIRVAQDGSVLGETAYVRRGASIAGRPLSGLVDPRKALDLFAGGATIVFQGLHRYHPPLTDLVARLELELGHPCQANAYLTPPGSQGFAVHSDSHDVFVFQTHGTKQWEVHHPRGERPCDHGDHAGRLPGRRRAAPARALHVPADRHAARRPRAGRRQPARDHRHQPAHVARPGAADRRPAPRRGRRAAPARRLGRSRRRAGPRSRRPAPGPGPRAGRRRPRRGRRPRDRNAS